MTVVRGGASQQRMFAAHTLKQSPENSAEITMSFTVTETHLALCMQVCQIVAEKTGLSE